MTLFTLMNIYTVTLCLACAGIASSHIRFTDKQNGHNLTTLDDHDYFNKLCNDFTKCLPKHARQFGALTIGKLKATDFLPPLNTLTEGCVEIIDQNREKINYNVALPNEHYIHSEVQLLDNLKKMKKWQDGRGIIEVYLFSYWSPCESCSKHIVETAKATGMKLHLSWQAFYQSNDIRRVNASTFFKSMETLFKLSEKNMKLSWINDNKACGNFKRLSYQYLFYECLVKTGNDKKAMSYAKIVNRMVYACIHDLDTYQQGDKCIDAFIKDCLKDKMTRKIYIKCKPRISKRPLLGPPLNPAVPKFGSQSLDDLRGNYDIGFKQKECSFKYSV